MAALRWGADMWGRGRKSGLAFVGERGTGKTLIPSEDSGQALTFCRDGDLCITAKSALSPPESPPFLRKTQGRPNLPPSRGKGKDGFRLPPE